MSVKTSRPVITPGEPIWGYHALFLTVITTAVGGYILRDPPRNVMELTRIAVVLIGSSATFSILSARSTTLQQVCAIRLALPHEEFRKKVKGKTVLTANGVMTIFHLLLATSLLSTYPTIFHRLTQGNVGALAAKVGPTAAWFFAAVNVTIVAVCAVMMLTQGEMKVEFTNEVDKDQVPLKVIKANPGEKEWRLVAATSRRHDVYLRQAAEAKFEVSTRLAANHPLYNPDKPWQPSGPILTITL